MSIPRSPERSHVLLAPAGSRVPESLGRASVQPGLHSALLREMQRLRGRIYVEDGAIPSHALTADGRHHSSLDESCWHILTMGRNGNVEGCLRLLVHTGFTSFDGLFVSGAALARSPQWGTYFRTAVERELRKAISRSHAFVEVGGWVVDHALRHSREALKLVLNTFAFGELAGGATGIATATFRNESAPMLRRLGGQPLQANGREIPSYFDPQYGADMALLKFEPGSYGRKYAAMVAEQCTLLRMAPVICPAAPMSLPTVIPAAASITVSTRYAEPLAA